MKLRYIIFLLCLMQPVFAQKTIRVGAKHFNEGYILSEMVSLLLEDKGFIVESVLMKSISLPTGLADAIEAKLEAEQEAQRQIVEEVFS